MKTPIRWDSHCKVAGITPAFLHTFLHTRQLLINPLWKLILSHRFHQRLHWLIQFSRPVSLVALEGGWFCVTGSISPFWSPCCGFAAYLDANHSKKAGQGKQRSTCYLDPNVDNKHINVSEILVHEQNQTLQPNGGRGANNWHWCLLEIWPCTAGDPALHLVGKPPLGLWRTGRESKKAVWLRTDF